MNAVLNIFKTLFVAVIAFVVIFASYFFIVLGGDETKLFFSGVSEEQAPVRNLTETERNLSKYLNELEDVELDVNFYLSTTSPTSIAFDGLKDFKKEIPTLESGRKNPFEPVD